MLGSNAPIRIAATILAGIALPALFACAGDSDTSTVQRSDSAGVEIVVSTETDRPLEWQFQRLFALGGAEEGPESFFVVTTRNVGADAHGNLYVLDRQNARIVAFDSDGQFLRSMGGQGGGPGEMQMPASLSVSPGGAVSVFDFGKGVLVRFDGSGNVENELPLRLYPTPNDQRHFRQFNDTVFTAGTLFGTDMEDPHEQLRRIVGADTTVLADLPIPPPVMAMYEQCGGGLRQPPLFAPELAWDVHPGLLAMNFTAEYSVSILEAGNLTRKIRRNIEATAASHDLAVAHLGEGFHMNFGHGPCLIAPAEMVEKRGYADLVPVVGNVFLSPSGELWVQRFSVDREASRPIDVFDVSGAYVGTIERESFSPVLLLPGDRVGVVETDEFDVARLVVFSIER